MMLLAAIPLAAQLVVLVADKAPELNVEPSCRAAAARSASKAPLDACLRIENDAHSEVAKRWTEFQAADRSHCLQLSTMGGSPSYVELLTCLEMASTARALPKAPPSTTGVGTANPRP